MLVELSVRNLALIEALVIDFGPGANILTGETGAGKSILVGALGLLMGRRAGADLVRAGAGEAEVSAFFELEEPGLLAPSLERLGLAPTREIVLRRVVGADGRGRAYVNGRLALRPQLAALGEELLSISGQHDQQSLLKTANQLDYLDHFGRPADLLQRMRAAWQKFGGVAAELKALEDRLREAGEKRDLFEFQRDEIRKIDPRPGEDEQLLEEKNRARNSGRLLESLASAAELLGGEPGNVVEKLGRARRHLETAAAVDPRLGESLNTAREAFHQVADLSVALERLSRDLDLDPDRLEWVEERLNALAKLKRKYNLPLAGIIERGRRLSEILDELDSAGLDLARLRRACLEAREEALEAARALHQARAEAGRRLALALAGSLKPLGFPKIELEVRVTAPPEGQSPDEIEKRLGPDGYDRVDFLFCPNPGEGLKPLAKIASGGELSRVMLALKTVQERSNDQLMVFDEIDSGLGGATAEAAAAKMAALAARQQLVVITHLPQMAALPGRHFVVSKEALDSGRTVTAIKPLESSQRVGELARMLGGATPSREAVALAGQMLAGMSASALAVSELP
ncbi:MAG: DNA repair protein RecN [Candidatus Adiutrix sp.]|jgi:DNA repair protein RecN (Recombination protein N)|nr:DNA repair protein RecN [Candidatus Adiutrix sp.]